VLKYKYSNSIDDLDSAVYLLTKSVEVYQRLASLTEKSYLYANSMQTQQRKIPVRGSNGTYKHWTEMVPVFETELTVFKHKIDSLKSSNGQLQKTVVPFANAGVKFSNSFTVVQSGASLFSDTNLVVKNVAGELKGLKAIQLSYKQMQQQGSSITFTNDKPVKVLVGYFKFQRAAFTKDTVYLKAPELETNASADDYGQAEIKISNAIAIDGMPPVNIHSYSFKAGTNTLKLEKGVCLILGFVVGDTVVPIYDAQLMSDPKNKNIDWLFE